jgi:hypothetical protein
MALTFPRRLFLEMYLAGGWRDVTEFMRSVDGITIERGLKDEQGRVPSSRMECVLDDDDGHMDPDNPLGQWFGSIGEGTPTQLGLIVGEDLFSTAVVNGMGTGTTGEVWSIDAAATAYQVNGGSAKLTVVAASSTVHAWQAAYAPWRDYEVTVDVTVPYPNGASNSGTIIFRGASTATAWRLGLSVDSAGAVNINISDPSGVVFGSVVAVDVVSAGTYTLRLLVENDTIYGKAWPVASTPPLGWQVSATVDTGALPIAGWVGIRARSGIGAANMTVTFDNFRVRAIRMAGEAVEFEPGWNIPHTVRTVSLVVEDLTRRMRQGKQPLTSAMRRHIEHNTVPFAYWALDDLPNAEIARLTAGAGLDATYTDNLNTFVTVSPARICGKGDLAPWAGPTALFQSTALYSMKPTLPEGAVTEWTVHLAVAFDGVYGTTDVGGTPAANAVDELGIELRAYVAGLVTAGGVPARDQYAVSLESHLGQVSTFLPLASGVSVSAGSLYDGQAHLLSIRAVQSGANVLFSFYVDSVLVTSSTQNNYTLTNPYNVFFASVGKDSPRRSIAHAIVYGPSPPDRFDLYSALVGWPSETGGNRMARACSEEGVPFAGYGDLDDTAAMGPQYAEDTLLEVVDECEDTDQGIRGTARSFSAITYRTLTSTQNQAETLTLDYSARQVAPPLRPKRDDKNTRNLIRARRRDGGEYIAEQTTGPKNTAAPGTATGAVGEFDDEAKVNPRSDSQLAPIAWRLISRGTVAGRRYPEITVDLGAEEIEAAPSVIVAAMNADLNDRLTINNMQNARTYDAVQQVIRGYVERFADDFQHKIMFNTAPYGPYRVFVLDTDRPGSDTTTLSAPVAAGQALPYTFTAAVSDGTLWTTSGAEFPFDVMVGGQRLTISGISGGASPQTWTVSARVNGLDKAQIAGEKVTLADETVLG